MPRVGSHSSGGSFSHSRGSSGGSFGGGGFRGSHHHTPRGPRIHVFLGHRYYGNSGASSIFFVLMMFVLFFSIPFWVMRANIDTEATYLKNDFAYYQELADNETPISATPLKYESYQIYEGTTYYYITFKIPSSNIFYSVYEFETTATYTISQAKEIMNQHTLLVCTNGSNAIQADFDINTDKEYAFELQKIADSKSGTLRIALILTAIGIGFGALGSVIFFKNMKKLADGEDIPSNNDNFPSSSETVSTSTQTTTAAPVTYCSYCGSKLKANETKCPDCGARARK